MATATSVNKTSLLPNNSEPQPDIIIDTNNIFTVAFAGTTQANAYAIGNAQPLVIVSNNTAANGGVLPTAAFKGQRITVFPSLVTNAPLVYPPLGGSINFGTVNAGVASTARKAVDYIAIDDTGLNYVTRGL